MARRDLEKRVKEILRAIVGSYIEHAEPVGSRTLSKLLDLGLSPATIRNVMADLTDQGYLSQPHASAGRVPTDKAYRFYVDSVVRASTLPEHARRMIDEVVRESPASLEKTLAGTTKLLALLTHFAGVIAAPRVNTTRLKLIEFIKVSQYRVFVVLITKSNLAYHKIIEVGEDLSQEFLNTVSRYLNTHFSDQSLFKIRERVLERLVEEKEQYDQLLAQVIRLTKKAFDFSDERELYVEGQVNILKAVNDVDSIQRLMSTLEERISILNLLDETITGRGVKILIGVENDLEDLRGFSLVTANYGNGITVLGSLGIIGPTRMDYGRIVPIIDYTAKSLTQTIANN
jgi:heat-inducible transcriptional repressor